MSAPTRGGLILGLIVLCAAGAARGADLEPGRMPPMDEQLDKKVANPTSDEKFPVAIAGKSLTVPLDGDVTNAPAVSELIKGMPYFVNPFQSAPAFTGTQPAAAPSSLDLLSASLQLNEKDKVISASVAPFALARINAMPLNNARVQVSTGGDGGRWTFDLSTALTKTGMELAPTDEKVKSINQTCMDKASADWVALVMDLTEDLRSVNSDPRLKQSEGSMLERTQEVAKKVILGDNLVAALNEKLKEAKEPANPLSFSKKYLPALKKYRAAVADCELKAYQKERFAVVTEGFSVKPKVGAVFFPLLSAPDDLTTETVGKQQLAGLSGSLELTYLYGRSVGVTLVGGYSGKRADNKTAKMPGYYNASVTIAKNLSTGVPVESDGFQSGYAVGLTGAVSVCREAEGCPEDTKAFKDKIKVDRISSAALFFDARASSKLQVRLTLPVSFYKPTSSADPAPKDIVQFVPTLSLTTAAWSL